MKIYGGGGLFTPILTGRKHTEVCSEIQNLGLALLIANGYVPDWTTGPNQTLPIANH
jgi:hypothetical protein